MKRRMQGGRGEGGVWLWDLESGHADGHGKLNVDVPTDHLNRLLQSSAASNRFFLFLLHFPFCASPAIFSGVDWQRSGGQAGRCGSSVISYNYPCNAMVSPSFPS